MKFDTIQEAAEDWVSSFNAIPEGVIDRLYRSDPDSIHEITPPCVDDRVYVYDAPEHEGEIIGIAKDKDGDEELFTIRLDNGSEVTCKRDDFEVEYDSWLPMWGTIWTFGERIDEEWANGDYLDPHLREMADCGFRLYEDKDLGLFFGIDGCGYDFYESHWIPLYKARGLHWHNEVT